MAGFAGISFAWLSGMTPRLESFQDRSFRFACDVVRLYVLLSQHHHVPLHLSRQMLRAGTSVGANLEEARAALSRRDSATRFGVALKEARETSYWLRLMRATDLVPSVTVDPLILEAGEMIGILSSARRKLAEPVAG
ncbi:MAG: four helix bundle protein [Vicinamibacterales bacterium]